MERPGQYESFIFAAPVNVAGTQVYVAAVVNRAPNNKFYMSEMVDSQGNYVRIEESPSSNAKSGLPVGLADQRGRDTAGPEGLSGEATPSAKAAEPMLLPNNSISENGGNVNGNSTQGAQNNRGRSFDSPDGLAQDDGRIIGAESVGAAARGFTGKEGY